ncbi:unnamed protein product [Caenorhabditis angaria]|uniref:Uncharacterized protein n=1 Tax=Caenorhabditis angaria TaxID=860376 RepID=A0A9P1N9R9_9PELO|nr:unnamed protein product [Caenorhabditis angaria]
MPGSVTSVETSPQILTYVFSVFGLVTSLMLTTVGYANNAWIVLTSAQDLGELQRGIRGHDCYRNITSDDDNLQCLPWELEDKTSKFPRPFNGIVPPSDSICWSQYIALIIFLCQFAWLAYSIAQCCSSKAADYLQKYRLKLYRLYIATLWLFAILFFFIVYSLHFNDFYKMNDSIFEKNYGNGMKIFLFGGLTSMIIAFIFLFKDELKDDWNKSSFCCLRRRHQPLPTRNDETEMH